MDVDTNYIAGVSRQLREFRGFTQENLAEIAHLSTRTVEKVESGRHRPDAETLRRVAKAFGVGPEVFRKPTEAEAARLLRDAEREWRKSVLVTVSPVNTAGEIVASFGACHAVQSDTSAVTDDEALVTSAALIDYFRDLMDLQDDISMSERLEAATEIAALCRELGQRGYHCCMGGFRQVLHGKDGQSDLLFRVALVTMRPNDETGPWRVLVRLDGGWEAHLDDRPVSVVMHEESAELPQQGA